MNDTGWVIKIADVQQKEHLSFYVFELFRKTQGDVLTSLSNTAEPLILSEEHFHELTSDLSADVYNDGLLILKDGCANSIMVEYPSTDVANWLRGVRSSSPGDFLHNIVRAAFHADGNNLILMMPLLRKLKDKYPKYSVL